MIEQPNDHDRYGPDLLLMNEVLNLPFKKRQAYLKNMEIKERGRLLSHVFLNNLNSNVKREMELEEESEKKPPFGK